MKENLEIYEPEFNPYTQKYEISIMDYEKDDLWVMTDENWRNIVVKIVEEYLYNKEEQYEDIILVEHDDEILKCTLDETLMLMLENFKNIEYNVKNG